MKSTLQLFKSERFLPIFIAQFGGAFNDNLFKSAMLIIVAFQLTDASAEASTINNLAALLFIVPFILFSTLAGQLADRADKSRMIQNNKIAEICIVCIGALALYSQSINFLLFILFALGVQSAFFGPNKYAMLAQLIHGKTLIRGNALVASGTFIAILMGTLAGGVLAQQQDAWLWIFAGCLATAFIGYLAARRLPKVEVGTADLKIDWNLLRQSIQLLKVARSSKRVWIAILGVSWFWFTGSIYLTQIPTIVLYIGGGNESVVTLFLGLFILGVGLGCAFAASVSSHSSELGLSPLALILIGLCGMDLASVPIQPVETLMNISVFLQSPQGLRISLDILLIGFFGGAFALPLYTELQQATSVTNRARIISINNVVNAIFMVVSAIIAIAILGVLQRELSDFLWIAAGFNIAFAIYLYSQTEARTLRFLGEIFSRLMYNIDSNDMDKLPEEGPALLVCNHVSYADPPIIFGSCKRPIRFLMDKEIHAVPFINYIFTASRTLPICSPLEDRKTYEASKAAAIESLKNGELLMIFPEGRLSPEGEIISFKRGFEKILEEYPVPVYPMAIKGVWGSFFSHGSGPALKAGFHIRLRRRKIKLVVGDALDPEGLTAKTLQEKVEKLRGSHK